MTALLLRSASHRSLALALSLSASLTAISDPERASAQDSASPPPTTTPPTTTPDEPPPAAPPPVTPSPAAAPSSEPTTTEVRSETGGSSARITRGGDPASAPAAAAPETPVNEEDDGRRADFIWFEVEGGVSYVDLVAFSQDTFTGEGGSGTASSFDEVTGIGPMVGVGVGFRVFFLALGARATFASYGDFEIGTVGGEVQFRVPTPVVEPWIRVGAGYAWQGNASYRAPVESDTTVYGWMLNGGLGLDFFVTWWLTLGVGASVDLLNMTRQTDPRETCMGPAEFCPDNDGDAFGFQASGFGQVGLHF